MQNAWLGNRSFPRRNRLDRRDDSIGAFPFVGRKLRGFQGNSAVDWEGSAAKIGLENACNCSLSAGMVAEISHQNNR